MAKSYSWTKRLLLLIPLAIGVAVLVLAIKSRQAPERLTTEIQPPKARVVTLAAVDVTPVVEGLGSVLPERRWNAVAEVSGRVVETHRLLRNGNIIAAGEVLLRLDPVDYQLALAQRQAELAELAVNEKNTLAMLEIERRALALAEEDLRRKRTLAAQGASPAAAQDAAEQALLARQRAVQDLENRLALVPHQKAVLETRRGLAERDLANTTIAAPFDLRVSGLRIEKDQFVARGQTILDGDSIDRVEVTAQLPLDRLFILMQHRPEVVIDPATLSETLPSATGISAELRLEMAGVVIRWPARFVRLAESIDPKTRTLGVVVAVDDPLRSVEPGRRPPLVRGMFVHVRLKGEKQLARLVMPRGALRDGAVWVVDGDRRLRRRPVTVLYSLGEISVIGEGLHVGDRVLVSDLVPVMEGMVVEPVEDDDLVRRLRESAQGNGGDDQ